MILIEQQLTTLEFTVNLITIFQAGPSGRAAVRLLRLWVRIPPGHGWFYVVSVVSCQIGVSASG
jgi:hypothetical protein